MIVVTNVVFYFLISISIKYVCRVFFVMFFFCTFSLFRPHAQHVIYKTQTTKTKENNLRKEEKIITSSEGQIQNKIKIKFSAIFFIWSVISSLKNYWLKISFPRKKFEFRGPFFCLFSVKKKTRRKTQTTSNFRIIDLIIIYQREVCI